MRSQRHSAILQLIEEKEIQTQEQLASLLVQKGFPVTQATLSRDIRFLEIGKEKNSDGKLIYAVKQKDDFNRRFERVFIEGVLSIKAAGNIVVIKTMNGMAMAVAAAVDSMNTPEIVGTIAGDDTVFAAVISTDAALRMAKKLEEKSRGGNNA